jgi:hypothetical protein
MYLDLEFESAPMGNFSIRTSATTEKSGTLQQAGHANQSFIPKYQEALMDFAKFCNFNLVFLTPYFWPRYPKDEPLNFADFPFAFQMFEFQMGGFMVFRGSRQITKSTSFCCRQQLNARFLPGFKSLYLAPRNQQLETYQNKMREIEHAMAGFNKKPRSRPAKKSRLQRIS